MYLISAKENIYINKKTRKINNKYFNVAVISLFLGLIGYSNISEASPECPDCDVTVNFTGVYIDTTCIVSINGGSNNETVTLKSVYENRLQNDGDEAESTKFSIALKECPINYGISLNFKSNSGNVNPNTYNLTNTIGAEYASNVELRIKNSNSQQLRIDDVNSYQEYVIPSIGSQVNHDYYVSYYANGNNSVKAGKVSAKSLVEIIYK